MKKVVIIGAGFGGISIAKSLKKKNVQVVLLDEHNYHNFQPLMYQVATGGLEPSSIAYPVRRIFRQHQDFSFRLAKVERVNLDRNTLTTSIGELTFDYLVIATGSQNNFFNFEPIKDKLLTLKSIPDSLKLRDVVFRNLEKALAENRRSPLEEIMNIAIVGGGPAGIELAGALAEMRRFVLPRDFPDLDLSKMNIHLYEAGPTLLSAMSEGASVKSLQYLKELDIDVKLNAKVTAYDGMNLELADGSSFLTDTVVWTAGVKGAPIDGLPEGAIVGGSRIAVDEYNRVKDCENIFAIGDVATHIDASNPKGLPMLAPVAQQQGITLAKNIGKLVDGKAMTAFVYKDKGSMAAVGRRKAVVDLPHYKFQGTFAWIVWMFVHILSLVGFRNKFVAFYDWVSNYFSYDRPLGLIIGDDRQKSDKP